MCCCCYCLLLLRANLKIGSNIEFCCSSSCLNTLKKELPFLDMMIQPMFCLFNNRHGLQCRNSSSSSKMLCHHLYLLRRWNINKFLGRSRLLFHQQRSRYAYPRRVCMQYNAIQYTLHTIQYNTTLPIVIARDSPWFLKKTNQA